ncbi:YkvA family protein [Selenomonas sp. TAMA-11512]|uniref:YkvA family protein n=1 Tax=Selenomonas sp. TAMA-11512 TaxID=3095337 RepID=UPI0030906106|nr:YkvA family protein [Selenomonas sp. TAMA-11512]
MWLRLFTLFKMFRRDFIVLLAAFKNPRTPRSVKIAFIAAMLYMISPIDIIPDSIPFLGVLDDAVILPTAIYGIRQMLSPRVRYEAEEQASVVERYMPHILIGVTVFLVLWLLILGYGAYSLIRWLIGALG